MGGLTIRAILDTSVLIAGDAIPGNLEPAISVVSIAELHYGLLDAHDQETRAARLQRLGRLESKFPVPLPIDDQVGREWGRLMAAVAERGGSPRSKTADLAIAATANVHGAVLITRNSKDLEIIKDLVAVRVPTDSR